MCPEGVMLVGAILVREEICSYDDIFQALQMQAAGDKRLLGEILIDMGCITDEQLQYVLAVQRGDMI